MPESLGLTHIVASGAVALCGARVSRITYERKLPECGWCKIAKGGYKPSAQPRPRTRDQQPTATRKSLRRALEPFY